jgi:hypothetical protein
MRYVGLDVHYGSSTYCILEENGREVQCETIRGLWMKKSLARGVSLPDDPCAFRAGPPWLP